MLNGSIEDNEVRFRGGAVSLHSGEAHIVGVHFIRNKAKEEPGGALHFLQTSGRNSVVNLTKTFFTRTLLRLVMAVQLLCQTTTS